MNHRILRNVTLLLAASLAPAVIAAAQDASVHSAPAARIPTAGYLGAAALEARLNQLVSQNSKTCALATLAKSPGGRPVWLLTLAAEGEQPSDERTALLLVGGADGDSPVSVAAALGVAERLLAAAASAPDGPESKLLRERVIHVVPCLNPDAYEAFFAPVQRERRLNESPTDSDRDGRADEDGPNDLNGDGLITVMRIRDPQGPWMIDPDEPRLMRKADRGKGERGEFLLQLEGLDDDGDGAINEDEPGGVDLDRNFPHFFESGVAAAGIHQVCEPETRALAEFVITNPHIAAAFVYGRDDNLLSVPKGQARGPEGRSYRDLHPEDIKVYEFLAERFKEKTGLKGAGGCRPEGALYAWLYSQQAIPTFAINPWWPPEGKPASQPAGDAATQPSSAAASGPASRAQPADEPPTPAESPAAEAAEPAAPAPQATPPPGRGRGGRGAFRTAPRGPRPAGDAAPSDDTLAPYVEATATNKAWLAYFDRCDLGGFVPWTQVPHPQHGKVEVGGFAPFFNTAAPAEQLESIAAAQAAFVLDIAERLPRIRVHRIEVEDRGEAVWRVKLVIVNEGYLPTHLGIALHTQQPVITVRPKCTPEQILGGRRLERPGTLAGSGGSFEVSWLIRGRPRDFVEFEIYSRVHGRQSVMVKLEATAREDK